jgi:hypothetical protein
MNKNMIIVLIFFILMSCSKNENIDSRGKNEIGYELTSIADSLILVYSKQNIFATHESIFDSIASNFAKGYFKNGALVTDIDSLGHQYIVYNIHSDTLHRQLCNRIDSRGILESIRYCSYSEVCYMLFYNHGFKYGLSAYKFKNDTLFTMILKY